MQNKQEEVIFTLKNNIRELVTLYEQCKDSNVQLIHEKKEFQRLLREKDLKIKSLIEESRNLKIAGSIISGDDTQNAKNKINQIVKDIDKCIALLNK